METKSLELDQDDQLDIDFIRKHVDSMDWNDLCLKETWGMQTGS